MGELRLGLLYTWSQCFYLIGLFCPELPDMIYPLLWSTVEQRTKKYTSTFWFAYMEVPLVFKNMGKEMVLHYMKISRKTV